MAERTGRAWGADGPVSMPAPRADDPGEVVSFGGFAFTAMGLVVDLTEADAEEVRAQGWSPGVGHV